MNLHIPRPLLTGVALAGTFSFVAACSGPSSSMNPTSPSAAASAAAGGNFTPNPELCLATVVDDPCEPPTIANGRFTGGGFQIADVKVTRGFEIHCDNILTNNLEVNWGGGNNFHMEKNTLTDVRCTRPVDPIPPKSPVSRIDASAVGECNGLPAAIDFILEDHGEPGTEDRAQLIISGGCTLNLLLSNLDGGNIQAHFDQPHK